MAKATAEETPDQTVVYLGNRSAIEILENPEHPGDAAHAVRTPISNGPKKNCTTVTLPPGLPLLEAAVQITDPTRGVWQAHSDADAPAWVASTDPALAQVLAAHYGGIEVRDPDPSHGEKAAAAAESEA